MEECVSHVNGLPPSWLRLLASPLRLLSAAMWQTVQHKVVSDYGILEEFVSMVTDIVPGLLSRRQRGQLILGLRARLILELCSSEASADPQIIQPHLDRLHSLRSLWNMEADNVDQEMSDSHFLDLVQSLLRDPEDRENFFRNVFHEDFGPMYDSSIQKLMWHFLSRLEQLLPSQNFEQVASLLSNASSVLNESKATLFQPQELKSLLEYQNNLNQLEEDDSFIEDTCIMTALCLPPVERVVIVKQQEDMDAMDGFVYTGCTEIRVGSERKEMDLGEMDAEDECEDDQQWFCVEVKSGDTEFVSEQIDIEPIESQNEGAQNDEDAAVITVTVEDGPVDMLDVVTQSTKDGMGKENELCENTHDHSNAGFQIPSQQRSRLQEMDCMVKLERVDMTVPSTSRPVRQNRGLKMKTYLSQMVKSRDSGSSCNDISSPGMFSNDPHSSKKDDLDQRTCNICGKVVSQAKFLQRHMNQHSTQQSYSCSECKRKYKSLRYLQEHKCPVQSLKDLSKCNESVQVDENETTASVPETAGEESEDLSSESNTQDCSYSTSVESKTHKKLRRCSPERDITTSNGPFICPHCSVEFKCQQTLRYHLRNICYNEQQVDPERVDHPKQCFKCDECDKAFKYKSTLDSHKHTHNPLYCHVCMKLVRDSEALALHKISHTPFQCNLCEGNFPVFKALYKHYNDAHNPSGPFVCAHCQTTFDSLKRFIRHEWKHTGHQPFQCPHCPKRFRSYSDLLEHQKKHTKEYPFLCWECGKKFRHSITLTRHVQREHKPGQPAQEKPTSSFSCAPCGKTFTSRWCFLKHDNFYHKGVRYPCTHCGKGFVGKDALVRHNLIHTGERPFKCDDCDKSFRSASELKVHRRYHTGERPFKCSVCDKGFVQSCFLTLHMRTHTGERPYICTVCGRGFASLHGLKRHTKLVHA